MLPRVPINPCGMLASLKLATEQYHVLKDDDHNDDDDSILEFELVDFSDTETDVVPSGPAIG